MRITARHWGSLLGVGLLLLARDVPVSHAAESRGTWLGVYSQELTSDLREGLDYTGRGVLINRVLADSPAERAGLKKGDLLVRVDSNPIDSPDDLAQVIKGYSSGESVELHVIRDGEELRLDTQLEERPSSSSAPKAVEPEVAPETFEAPEPFVAPVPPPSTHEHEHTAPDAGTMMFPGMGRGRLGVRVESLNPDLGDYFGVKNGQGALVLEVMKDTPAERSGLRAGDVITQVDRKSIGGSDDLISALGASDGRVSITVVRQGSRRTFEAELDPAPRAVRMRRGNGLMGWDVRGGPAMRKELEELREELRELRRDLEEMKKN